MIELELLAVLARPRQGVDNLGTIRSLCLSKSRQDLGEILPRYRKSQTSWQDLSNLGKMQKISPRTRRDYGEISAISARWRKSRRDSETHKHHGEISARSRPSGRDGGYLAAISPRIRISQTSWRGLYNLGKISAISARWKISRRYLAEIQNLANIMARSWRNLCNLGEMENISPRSRRDLESCKHHGEILAKSLQSRRDGEYLAAISLRFRILQTSWRDLGEISSISLRSLQS